MKVFQALLYCSHSPRFFHSSLFIRDAILCCDVIWRKSVRKISKFTPKFTLCIRVGCNICQHCLKSSCLLHFSFSVFRYFCLSVCFLCSAESKEMVFGKAFLTASSNIVWRYTSEMFIIPHTESKCLYPPLFILELIKLMLLIWELKDIWSWSWLVQAIFHPRIDKVVKWKHRQNLWNGLEPLPTDNVLSFLTAR